MLQMAIDMLDLVLYTWGQSFATLLYGIAIATGVMALFCRLRGGRKA